MAANTTQLFVATVAAALSSHLLISAATNSTYTPRSSYPSAWHHLLLAICLRYASITPCYLLSFSISAVYLTSVLVS